jgi:hypothetical protein
VADLDATIERLTEAERAVVMRFLERTAEAGERHAEALATRADTAGAREIAPPAPGLWS